MMETESLPILVVDVKANRRARIAYALGTQKLSCTDEQADELAAVVTEDWPDDPTEFGELLLEYVQVDWPHMPEGKLESVLRSLRTKYNDASAANGPKKMILRRMLFVTRGLDEHPEWWDCPCDCDNCRSC